MTVYAGSDRYFQELAPARGFQSSVDYRLHFGLGQHRSVDSITIYWPDRSTTTIPGPIKMNQFITISQASTEAVPHRGPLQPAHHTNPWFSEVAAAPWFYRHQENTYADFDRDRLLFHMLSTQGPKVCVGDVNGDGLSDFFICGAAGTASALYIQQSDGSFTSANDALLALDRATEDVACLFFDADGDGDLDLYVARGGNEFLMAPELLTDQLYFNDGQGNLSRSPQFLPTFKHESTSCVVACDYDQDGDIDLFVGIRLETGHYGAPTNGYILNNDGKGQFRNVSAEVAPDLAQLGMITDAIWADIDQDGDFDLVVVGEWMPITVLINDRGQLKRSSQTITTPGTTGWWNTIAAADLDGDGLIDFVVGNHGLNSRFRASPSKPIELYVNDFDQNGTPEPILCQYNGDKSYPMHLRHDLVMQLPGLKKKYPQYHDYSEQTINDIFPAELLSKSIYQRAEWLETAILRNQGRGRFTLERLPIEAQLTPTYAIWVEDFDGDGTPDIMLGGNLYGVKPEVGRYDASYGTVLRGLGNFQYKALPSWQSGISISGQIRDFAPIIIAGKRSLLVGMNDETIRLYQY